MDVKIQMVMISCLKKPISAMSTEREHSNMYINAVVSVARCVLVLLEAAIKHCIC